MNETRRQDIFKQAVRISAGTAELQGDLSIPKGATGLVLFAHGSGSSRHSSRNRFVAEQLQTGGLATLLFDLLTEEEEAIDLRTKHLRFNIDLLAGRLAGATDWVTEQRETQRLSLGYFGASTGAAAALIAAAKRPATVQAVVSRGGRPDLAESMLAAVQAPTLLIVGGRDKPVIDFNEQALGQLTSERRLEIVPEATHLFEESGALEKVADLARQWFQKYLSES